MAKLHMDATRSASLFAERMVLVEGVTDSVLVRQFGHAWAGDDPFKHRFVDALTITVMGTRVGRWPADMLATPGHEIVNRLAVLTDTDTRAGETFTPPSWITDRDSTILQAFFSVPTLEPSITTGNEEAVATALTSVGIAVPQPLTSTEVDNLFRDTYRKRKAEFALALADAIMHRISRAEAVVVPEHMYTMFDFLYANSQEHVRNAEPPTADS
jgi:putative ATP-dependent endonuclease of OLD family